MDWAGPYISANYEIVGLLVYVGPDQTKFFSDAAASSAPLGEATIVLVSPLAVERGEVVAVVLQPQA